MPRDEPHKKLGKHQRGILLWLAEAEGVEADPDELVIIGEINYANELIEAMFKERAERETKADNYNRKRRKGTPWSASDYLGRKPTANERKAISRALSELAERDLIFRHSRIGKNKRTSHIALTALGDAIARSLMQKRRQSRKK